MFSVSTPFRGDYVGLRRNPAWRETLKRNRLHKMDQRIVFSDILNKINRSNGKVGKNKQGLLFLLTHVCAFVQQMQCITIGELGLIVQPGSFVVYKISLAKVQQNKVTPHQFRLPPSCVMNLWLLLH